MRKLFKFSLHKGKVNKETTVFPHIVAAATILFWIHLVRKLFKFSFPICNENLNSFLTRRGNYSRRENYSREETIWGNTVCGLFWQNGDEAIDLLLCKDYLKMSKTCKTSWEGHAQSCMQTGQSGQWICIIIQTAEETKGYNSSNFRCSHFYNAHCKFYDFLFTFRFLRLHPS